MDRKRAKQRQRRTVKQKLHAAHKAQKTEAEAIKASLRAIGCCLPFYESLDSYAQAFTRAIEQARIRFPSLVAVMQVPDEQLQSVDWIQKSDPELVPAEMQLPSDKAAYGVSDDVSTGFEGKSAFFHDRVGKLRSWILIAKKSIVPDRDLDLGLKTATLFHELGHIEDAELALNLRNDGSIVDIVSAETYAHCSALERLEQECMANVYETYYRAIEQYALFEDYRGEIGRRVITAHPKRSVTDWRLILKQHGVN